MLTLNDGRAELWQWDTGRTLSVDADCSQVHFSNKVFGRSIDVDVVDGAATIPDILLQTDKDLNVWAFVGTAENGYTKISKIFKVNRRNKPADYVFTPTDQMTLHTIQSQIGDLADLTTEAKDTLVAAINEAAKSGGGGSVQSDWNQNDEAKPDYIKNRPFYNETETVTVENSGGDKLNYFPVFAVGDTVTVNVDGVEHSLVAYDDNGSATIGDTTNSIDNGEGQLGWQIYFDKEYNGVWFYATEAHTVSYLGVVGYHKIDSKYLPDNPLNITGATVGQIAKITAVDGTGKPTAWAPVDMPDALPNPNALTFTGAVTGSYDGSAPVSVEIPSGGGGGSAENWRLVNTVTTAEDVSNIIITQDSDGNPLSLKKVKIFAKVRGNSASLSTWCRITVNNLTNNFYSDLQKTFAAKEGQDYYNYSRADFAIYAGRLMLELLLRSANNAASKNTLWWVNNSGCFENYPNVVDAITSIRMWSASAGIGAGTELMIYGVDA